MKIWRLEDAPEYFRGDFWGTQNKKKKKKNRKRGEGSRKCGVVRCIFEVPSRNRRGRKKKNNVLVYLSEAGKCTWFHFCDYMPKAAHWSLTDYMKTLCLFSGKQKKKKKKKKSVLFSARDCATSSSPSSSSSSLSPSGRFPPGCVQSDAGSLSNTKSIKVNL